MLTTTNYGLKKPEGTDIVNIDDLNNNVDIIDMKLKEIDIKASNIIVPVTKVNSKTGDVVLNANDIGITDTGNKTTTTNVEDALQETYNKIDILSGSSVQEKANKSDFDTHENDYTTFKNSKGQANGLAGLGSDGKVPSGQLPTIKDVDNGRYQSDFGFDGAVLSNLSFSNNQIAITYANETAVTRIVDNNSTSGITTKTGLKIHMNTGYTAKGIRATISANTNGITKAYILNSSKSVIVTLDITGIIAGQYFDIMYDFVANTDYYIVCDNNGSSFTMGFNSPTFPINSTKFNITSGYSSNADTTSYAPIFISLALITDTNISGTVTKTITPSDIKKWGNAKWTQTTPTNTSVVCDILKSDGTTVLKSNVASIADLSDIDITANPTIKVKWTLTRNTVNDTSPTVKDVSVTWEGKLPSDGAWQYITTQTVSSDTAQVDITGLSSFRKTRIMINNLCHTGTTGTVSLRGRFNNDATANYGIKNYDHLEFSNSTEVISYSYGYVATSVIIEFDNISSLPKTILSITGYSSAFAYGGTWNNITDLVNKLSLYLSTNNIKSGARIEIWGCK